MAIADLGFKGYSHIHGTIGVQTKITFEIRLERSLAIEESEDMNKNASLTRILVISYHNIKADLWFHFIFDKQK